uniref:Uncharacterized protein n=1 Tax=Aegilops tauschii subsp. strangulata TaxID=200361 RepID=A0A453I4G9_AEGTS
MLVEYCLPLFCDHVLPLLCVVFMSVHCCAVKIPIRFIMLFLFFKILRF